jgi:bifunctional non-homologous end joining protein LigD
MLATAVTALPSGSDWAFEFKWDGVRALFDVSESGLRITSRTGRDVTSAYPELAALADGGGDALVDGEIVAIRDGRPSFELLQTRMNVRSPAEAHRLARTAPVTFVAFDLLRRYGVDLTGRPYAERRATLERWIGERPDWTISPSFDDGVATEAAARQHGLEGVVAKRVDSGYRWGTRSRDWVKLRFVTTGDFAIVGWEGSADHPDELSSLILASWTAGGPVYAGKVGSGLSSAHSAAIRALLHARTSCALAEEPQASPGRVAHWVEPEVVVEVGFTERTDDGRLRHPVLRRLRTDKTAEETQADD